MKTLASVVFAIFALLNLGIVFAPPAEASEAAAKNHHLSKREAQQQLEKTGFRWQQTYSAIAESQAKLGQAEGASGVHVNAFSREFVMRTNELILGISDSGPLNIIGGGVTGVQASYEVYNGASVERLEAAKVNLQLGRATTAQYQNELKFLLQLRYLNAQQFQLRAKAADGLAIRDNSLAEWAHLKVAQGLGVPLDLVRSDALVEKDKFKKLEAEVNYQKSIHEMAELLPDLDSQVELDPLEFHELPPVMISALENQASNRPEMKVADLTFAAMQKLKAQADAESGPTVAVFAEVGTIGTQALGLVNSPTGSVGLQINMPLYNGGYLNSKSAEVLSKLNSLEWQKKQIELETRNQLATTKAQLDLARQVVLSTRKQLDYARRAVDYAEKKIKIGSAGNLDLVNAQNELATVTEYNIQAIFAYEATKLQFFHLIANLEDYLSLEASNGGNHG